MRRVRSVKLKPDSRARHAVLAALDHETQDAFASRVGIGQSQVSQIVWRKAHAGLEVALKLSDAGIPASWWREPPTVEQISAARVRENGAA